MSDGARCHYCRKNPCICEAQMINPKPLGKEERACLRVDISGSTFTAGADYKYCDALLRALDDIEALEARQKKLVEALKKLWKRTPKSDNGYCLLCPSGRRNFTGGGLAKCTNKECLSHELTAALREIGESPERDTKATT